MKRWELSRRTLLRGAGAALGLPLLEAMLPSAASAAAAAPKRLVVFYVPNGMIRRSWTPADEGAGWTVTPTLAPLAPLKSDVLVLTNLANRPAKQRTVVAPHSSGTAAFLTAAQPKIVDGPNVHNAVSLDQVVAKAFQGRTRFPSLELGIDAAEGVGDCERTYACAYLRHISWATPTTPVAKEVSPLAVFDRLFKQDGSADPLVEARRRRQRQSVLDLVREDAHALQRRLGRTDQQKLDEYLTSVRELEARLQRPSPGAACAATASPAMPREVRTHTRLMLDLMVLAMQCDATRVLSFMLGNGRSKRVFDFLGVSGAYHTISHHGGREENLQAIEKIKLWEVEQLAYLLTQMKKTRDASGADLLDGSVVYFGSEVADPNDHAYFDLPVVLAGRAGGALKPGRHVRNAREEPVGNLFVSILQALDIPATEFGDDGTRPLGGLA